MGGAGSRGLTVFQPLSCLACALMVILDTNVLIEIIRKNGEVIHKCDSLGTGNLAITSITRNEFLLGSRDKESFASHLKFVGKFQLLTINESIDKVFSQLCETYALSHRPKHC